MVAGFLQRHSQSLFGRIVITAVAIFMGLAAICWIASAYFYYSIYYSDYHYTSRVSCDTDLAASALKYQMKNNGEPDLYDVIRKSTEYQKYDFWKRVDFNHSSEYQSCLFRTGAGGDLFNIDWTLHEARNFAILGIIAFLLLIASNPLMRALRWIWRGPAA